MNKYIFHMANGKKRSVHAETLELALTALNLTTDVPIGTRDGKATTIVYIETESKGEKWTQRNEPEK
jgi:hypothetical protein